MRDELTEVTSRLVAIESVNPDLVAGGAGEGEVARYVAGWLERAGLEVELDEAAPGRPNVVARARGTGGGRSLMLNAHMDTVGTAGMEGALEPRVADGRLYGRGAYDMKGSLAAIMIVAACVRERRLAGDVIVTAVADEEAASLGTAAVVAGRRADAAVVVEPTELGIAVAHKGFVAFELETTGRAAHGSRPDLGVDAIAKMGRALVGLEALDRELRARPSHPLLGAGSLHASLIEGGQEFSSYPDRCVLKAERRTVPGESPALVDAELRRVLERAAGEDPDFRGELRTVFAREPFEVDPGEAVVRALRGHARSVLGAEPELVGVPFWTDAALLGAAGIPTVVFGPAGEGAHAGVEWVDLESLERCAEILLGVAGDLCA